MLLFASCGLAFGKNSSIAGRVFDPQGKPIVGAVVVLTERETQARTRAVTDAEGRFQFPDAAVPGSTVRAEAVGFHGADRVIPFDKSVGSFDIQLTRIVGAAESVTVTANVNETSITLPDPGQRILVRQELLDANPGRPGAPVSLPGLPIETASGGIKAPQYFVPGVAGDHGEPIAQYIAVGNYLVTNNLSANAHGNGYADPNIFVPQVISGVQVDGGAFNVLEGNHALNLAAAYTLRSHIDSFLEITGDYRDLDVVSGFGPSNPQTPAWIVLEAAAGNGLLDRLEHRQQYKFNGFRAFRFGEHELTLLAIGYYGFSYIPGLVPVGVPGLHDTIDPRQKDQTHTFELVANDVWKLSSGQQLSLSSFFRTYNLALFSNFGDGLIRQSEFRTVVGGNATYVHSMKEYLKFLAGIDYVRDAPRRLNLDHYTSIDPNYYGPFQTVTSNNVTIGDVAPYVAINGGITSHLRYYLGFRRDEISFGNQDLIHAANSFDRWVGVNNPKATVSFIPGTSWLPTASLSWGESFFTNDPRIGTGTTQGTPVERAHSYQLVVDKLIGSTDLRLTLGHTTTDATLAKIDADTGLQENEGPGRLRYLTALVRHRFGFGFVQASFSKADARDLLTGEPTPEAPRTIFDALGTVDRLPLQIHARGEFEYVGQKPLGDAFNARLLKQFRAALMRSFSGRRLDAGVNFLIAGGYTGQTTEVLALPSDPAPFARVVGVRLASYIGASVVYHFGISRIP